MVISGLGLDGSFANECPQKTGKRALTTIGRVKEHLHLADEFSKRLLGGHLLFAIETMSIVSIALAGRALPIQPRRHAFADINLHLSAAAGL